MLVRGGTKWLRALCFDERGQIAFSMLLMSLGAFILMALSLDGGLWFLDHRKAQGQAEAASLAAVIELPDSDPSGAFARALEWLQQNGVDAADLPAGPILAADQATIDAACNDIGSEEIRVIIGNTLGGAGDPQYDTVRTCIRRESIVLSTLLSGVGVANISAVASAKGGSAAGTTVMPWAAIPPDRDCDAIGEMCDVDENGDGDTDDPGETGACTFLDCPFGLDPERLIPMKNGNNNNCTTESCPAIAITACGTGASNYRDCITGDEDNESGFEVGDTVVVETAPGNLGVNTSNTLDDLAAANGDSSHSCDVASTPDGTANGLDADVVTGPGADDLPANRDDPLCDYRKVVLAIVCYEAATNCVPPNGSNTLLVVGLAVYYIADWAAPQDVGGNTAQSCDSAVDEDAPGNYNCGVTWGFLLQGEDPAKRFNLDKIGGSPNPFAPVVVALVE